MAWPFTPITTYVAKSLPTIKAYDLNQLQAYVNNWINGSVSTIKAAIDGVGNTDSSALPAGTLYIDGKAAEATASLKFADAITAYNVRLQGDGAAAKVRLVQATTGWERWTNCYYVPGGGDNWARDQAGVTATREVLLSGVLSIYYYTAPPATWPTSDWATRQSLGTTTGGDVTAARATTAAGVISSATAGAGQAVPLGSTYKDTAILAWGTVLYAAGPSIVLTRGANLASVSLTGVGEIGVAYQVAAPNTSAPVVTLIDPPTAVTLVRIVSGNLNGSGFQIQLSDIAGAACDMPVGSGFTFIVVGG